MADAAVTFFLEKLDSLITQEARLLSGVHKDIVWLRDELSTMRAFLEDAGRRKTKEPLIRIWVEQVRDVVYDVEDILDEFVIKMEPQHRFSLKKLIILHRVGTEIQGIKARIRAITDRRRTFDIQRKEDDKTLDTSGLENQDPVAAYPYFEEACIVGIESDVEILVGWLLNGSSKLEAVSVVGMGGIGKTTLAKKVYNMEEIKMHFDCRSWVSVSQSFTLEALLTAIINGFYEDEKEAIPITVEAMDERQLHRYLNLYLQEKRYLVVLDDVWSEDVWNGVRISLPNCEHGSRIVFTTRLRDVASLTQIESHVHNLQPLADEEAWTLFCNTAIRQNDLKNFTQELEEVGKLIVNNCEGLPLAIVAIGGMISKRAMAVAEWNKVLKSINWELANNSLFRRVRGILSMIYNDMPPLLKYCFLYCCLLPDGYEIKQNTLIRLWVAEGFVVTHHGLTREEVAMAYLKELIVRNLIQVVGTRFNGQVCRVHDVVRKLALSISENENFGAVITGVETKLDDKTRRTSIHEFHDSFMTQIQKSRLRTLLMFGMEKLPYPLSSFLPKFRFLRVLDMGGVHIPKLPNEIGKLIPLRFLGLRNTGIQELPKSLKKLHRLETLDVMGSNLESLPSSISSLQNLNHLLVSRRQFSTKEFMTELFESDTNLLYDQFVPTNVCIRGKTSLHALKYIRVDSALVKELADLVQLERLHVQLVRREDGKKLWASIQKMQRLQTLVLLSVDQHEPMFIDSLPSLPPHLTQLLTDVVLEKLPNWLCCLSSLTELCLISSALVEDPLSALQSLPNLAVLVLSKAYNGKTMGADGIGGFPKLKFLIFHNLEELQWWGGMKEGSMPNLKSMYVIGCKKLKMLDESFKFLTSIQYFFLGNMPEEFVARLRSDGGEDNYKIQHIPVIEIFYLIDGELVSKYLE
ncbi:disease resistance protein RPM1 [Amborella trichopoda]|uniref:Uncharacterized protein n=1 Tax=Amborella trichopoda TaxID=13333 RepID=W1NN37_AMBTC|nr:disease resistance protein RPM1 [Amborella trichopoda]ERM96739.1 hypothetical protein AMTR_s00202p00037220 [Amborella trichopoda]|eukprot:XP_006829323.1 disease resistance protein RPM1 [Amborella trichopoda]